jgi:hypothetical protein
MAFSSREFSALVDKGDFPEQVAVPIDARFDPRPGRSYAR